MKYEAVIFDLFGTLVDIFSRREYKSVLEEMISILSVPSDKFVQLWADTAKQRGTGIFRSPEENIEYICRNLKEHVTEAQVKEAARVRFDFVSRSMTPSEDALETLSHLKAEGYRTALISNCATEPPVIWQNTPFAPLIDVTIFSSLVSLQKPDPRIYHLAAERLSVKTGGCLYIGDGDGQELTGAHHVGMHPVLIRTSKNDTADALRDDAETDDWNGPVIASLKEVLGLLR